MKLDPAVAEGYILHRLEIYADNPFNDSKSRVVWIWSKHSNMPMSMGAEWGSENDTGALVVGDENGFVRYVDTGSQDDGVDYASTIQTASRVIDGKDLRTGRVRRVTILQRASGVLTGSLRYDQNTSDDVTFTNGDTTLAPDKDARTSIYTFDKMGRYVSVRLSRTGEGPNLEIHRIDLDIALRSSRVHRSRNAA